MTVTTVTIEKLCLQEEEHWPDDYWKRERLQWIEEMRDGLHYGFLETDFASLGTEVIPHEDRPQLWCEACKFHKLRLSGMGLHEALDRMVAPR